MRMASAGANEWQHAGRNRAGKGHQKPKVVPGQRLPAPACTDRGSPGTPQRALLPLRALTGRPLYHPRPDGPNFVTAVGILAPYPPTLCPHQRLLQMSLPSRGSGGDLEPPASNLVGSILPLPFPPPPGFQPRTLRPTQPAGDREEGRCTEKAISSAVPRRTPRAGHGAAPRNPPQGTWAETDGFGGKKK